MKSVQISLRRPLPRSTAQIRATGKESPASEKKLKLERGFRWDPALQRWIEEKRNVGKEFDASDMIIKTKTGDEYVVWPVVHSYLVEKDLKSVTCTDVEDLMAKGYTLLDVRLAEDFKKSHAKGAINVPLFRPITREGGWNAIKKVAYVFMGMTPTERNTEFVQQVAKAVPTKSKLLVMCNRGGTLETIIVGPGENPKTCKDPDRAFGRETRSLKAIFELFQVESADNILRDLMRFLQDGFKDMFYVEGGFGQWCFDGRELESD